MKRLLIIGVLTVFLITLLPTGAQADVIDWRQRDQAEILEPSGDGNPWGEIPLTQSIQNPRPDKTEEPTQQPSEVNEIERPSSGSEVFEFLFDIVELLLHPQSE